MCVSFVLTRFRGLGVIPDVGLMRLGTAYRTGFGGGAQGGKLTFFLPQDNEHPDARSRPRES